MYCGYQPGCRERSKSFARLPDLDPDSKNHMWVCAGCGLPTRMVFEKVTDMLIPRMAAQILSEVIHGDGTATLTWATGTSGERIKTASFHPYPFGADLMHPGRSHLLMIWEKLDACIEQVYDPIASQKELDDAKARGGAFAEVIAQLMSPYYNSRDAVVGEAVARYQARTAGTDHESPGLAEVYWNPRPITESERNGGVSREVTVKPLDEQKSRFCKTAIEGGSMDAKALADMFGVSVEVIKASVDSLDG